MGNVADALILTWFCSLLLTTLQYRWDEKRSVRRLLFSSWRQLLANVFQHGYTLKDSQGRQLRPKWNLLKTQIKSTLHEVKYFQSISSIQQPVLLPTSLGLISFHSYKSQSLFQVHARRMLLYGSLLSTLNLLLLFHSPLQQIQLCKYQSHHQLCC